MASAQQALDTNLMTNPKYRVNMAAGSKEPKSDIKEEQRERAHLLREIRGLKATQEDQRKEVEALKRQVIERPKLATRLEHEVEEAQNYSITVSEAESEAKITR